MPTTTLLLEMEPAALAKVIGAEPVQAKLVSEEGELELRVGAKKYALDRRFLHPAPEIGEDGEKDVLIVPDEEGRPVAILIKAEDRRIPRKPHIICYMPRSDLIHKVSDELSRSIIKTMVNEGTMKRALGNRLLAEIVKR